MASTPDLDSPMYSSSDMSDIALSPVGSMALNTDILRKELRNKIYARRKSQGLEELTVEFKPPEKTEVCTLIYPKVMKIISTRPFDHQNIVCLFGNFFKTNPWYTRQNAFCLRKYT